MTRFLALLVLAFGLSFQTQAMENFFEPKPTNIDDSISLIECNWAVDQVNDVVVYESFQGCSHGVSKRGVVPLSKALVSQAVPPECHSSATDLGLSFKYHGRHKGLYLYSAYRVCLTDEFNNAVGPDADFSPILNAEGKR